ncbi:MAG: adenylate kinase [Dehalococcoidia bacterium]
MYLILLGAPGAGKGTQAGVLSRDLGLTHIATGDLFREAIKKETGLGKRVKDFVEKGLLVPDEITIELLLERIEALEGGIVLDGFPRTLEQARALDGALGDRERAVDSAVYIRVSSEELLRRLSGRWICRECQTPYHAQSSPPRVPGVCDRCDGELYQREDDTAETVRKRLGVYFAQTAPVIDFYRGQAKLVEVNGEQEVDVVGADMVGALGVSSRGDR